MQATVQERARASAIRLADLVRKKRVRFVLAESCSGGMAAALLTAIPGISEFFCGSAVTYRAATKQHWLDVSSESIKTHSTESQPATNEMALGVLRKTPQADWSAAITGHLGPNAPLEKDGRVFVTVATRSGDELRVVKEIEHKLDSTTRMLRQVESAGHLINFLFNVLERD